MTEVPAATFQPPSDSESHEGESEQQETSRSRQSSRSNSVSVRVEQDETDWKAEAQKWEKRAKANIAKATEFDKLTESSKTAEQKAAEATQRAERLAAQFVSAKLETALTGIVPNAAAVVGTLNHALYVTADGEIDADKVTALQDTYRALGGPSGPRAPAPNPAQGNSTQPKTLGEMVADAERNSDGSRQSQRDIMRLKSRQLLQHK